MALRVELYSQSSSSVHDTDMWRGSRPWRMRLACWVRLNTFWTQCHWAKPVAMGELFMSVIPQEEPILQRHVPPRMRRELRADVCNVYTGSTPSILAAVFFSPSQANDYITSAGKVVCLLLGLWVYLGLFKAFKKSRVWGWKEVTYAPTSPWKSVPSEWMVGSSGCLGFRLLLGEVRDSIWKRVWSFCELAYVSVFLKPPSGSTYLHSVPGISSCDY